MLVLVGKVPAWLGVMLGAIKAGLVSVPCSDMLRARDLAFRARDSRAKLIVADRALEGEVDAMRGLLDEPITVLYLDDAQLLLQRQPLTADTEETLWCDEALVLYTSGTTKEPKGATHSHAYLFAKRMQAEHWLGAQPGDLVWCTAGTGWAKSIWNVLLGPWSRGAEIVMHEGGFDTAERLELLESLGVTILCQAPTEYRMMAKLDALGSRPLPSLRHAVSAGEPLNPEVIARFREALGVTIYDGYGQTENTLLVANTRERAVRPGSMGWPTPGHQVAVIDDEGNEVADGVEGDIALYGRPPSLFMRYWNAPDETAAVFRDNWYLTGDRATRDEDGSMWFTGRADDVILSAAYRIGPFEVESALLEHPGVAESAVIGKPDDVRGQIVKAYVVLRDDHAPTKKLAEELKKHVKKVTAPYKYPREIEFVTELPKTASGKIRRAELRRLDAAAPGQAQPPAPVSVPDPPVPPEAETDAALRADEADVEVEVEAEATVEAEVKPAELTEVALDEAIAGTEEADAAVARFLEEAAERRRAEAERQWSKAEESRLARRIEQEHEGLALEQGESQRRAEQLRAAEAAASLAAEELERRREEAAIRLALAEAEQRRRVVQRQAEEVHAVERRRRRWRQGDEDRAAAGGSLVARLTPYGAGQSDEEGVSPAGGNQAA